MCIVAQYLCKQEAIKDILNWIELNIVNVRDESRIVQIKPTVTNSLPSIEIISKAEQCRYLHAFGRVYTVCPVATMMSYNGRRE